MTSWFPWAVASALFAGLHTFLVRVAAARAYPAARLTATGSALSSAAGLALTLWLGQAGAFTAGFTLAAGLLGALFLAYSVLRQAALGRVDSTIFFPVYKVVGPALTAAIGLLALGEPATPAVLAGLALSCAVPLLLVTRGERARQRDLWRGLSLTLASTVLAALAAAGNAWLVHGRPERALPALAISHAFAAAAGGLLALRGGAPAAPDQAQRGPFLALAVATGAAQFLAFGTLLMALVSGGLATTYAVNAQYILIPVVLSVLVYREHFDRRKAAALLLSLLAVGLLRP